ncbi:MAG: TIGR03751 family conjugal transfer lipoprotein [Pseudomonadota bacterium]|nr:TIGR03751 family conjugal transfer lipoprotein [Pseudomonadota bacterium]
MQQPLTHTAATGLISLLLVGCAGTKDTILPQDGPSMKAIYEEHIHEMNAQDPLILRQALAHRPMITGEAALEGYTRDAASEIDSTFPRLPNPTLVLYVFPHLAGDDQVPVPGYATAFSLYERVEYSLPGEVPTPGQRGKTP